MPAFGRYVEAHPEEFDPDGNILPDRIEAYDFSAVLEPREEELEINTDSHQKKGELEINTDSNRQKDRYGNDLQE